MPLTLTGIILLNKTESHKESAAYSRIRKTVLKQGRKKTCNKKLITYKLQNT